MSAVLFSERIDWMLYALSAGNVPVGSRSYPSGLHWIDARLRGGESVRDMFRRCVRNGLEGQVAGCRIEDNLAVFAFVRWVEGKRLIQAHIQAIKTEDCDLETYYSDDGLSHQETYYRLDLERFVGQLFTHPYPHVHAGFAESPRYTLNGWKSENVVVDFLEHVYLQSFPVLWTAWAERLWNKHWDETFREPEGNPFRIILDAAISSQYGVLETYRTEIAALKSLLAAQKASAFDLRCDGARCQLLGYP